MKELLPEARDQLVTAYRAGQPLALLFDYDGTLTPIVDRPELAKLSRQTRLLLASLVRRPHVFVGVLSGRRLNDLKARVGVKRAYYAGTGGLELELGKGLIVHPQARQ